MTKPPEKPPPPPPPPEPPPPPPKPDQVERLQKRGPVDAMGATRTAVAAPDRSFEVLAAPAELPPDHGVKDAERLKLITRSQALAQDERRWLDKLQVKLASGAPVVTRKLGSGPWQKKYATDVAFVEALSQTVGRLLGKALNVELGVFSPSERRSLFLAPFAEISGQPPLHLGYVTDMAAHGLQVNEDDIRQTAHAYVMASAHVWFRRLIALKRTDGADASVAASGLSKEQIYTLEVNFCQHYVPSTTVAHFESQPLRTLAREIANRFRTVAFGGQ